MKTESYDRTKDVKQFDDPKTGVKGLVDSGITTIPCFFIHPPDVLYSLQLNSTTRTNIELIPTIDLSGIDSEHQRTTIVENIGRACRQLGVFQIINHGIDVEALEHVLGAIKRFHEQPADVKARLYGRDINNGISFFSNIDLLHSKAATWKDTLQIKLGPTNKELDEIPEICRNAIEEWNQNVTKIAELLMGLLCDGLGVEKEKLKKMTFLEGRVMVAHYYPYCPQPDLTMGMKSHTDPGALTILLQDQKVGLQVKYAEEWVDVNPVPGALVINMGDLFQIVTNDEFKSIEHRVLANPFQEPRISTAVFFSPSNCDDLYGPLAELVSPEKPAHYGQFTYRDFIRRFYTKELDGKSILNYYRLSETE